MRKVLLLCFSLFLTITASAQKVTLFSVDFENLPADTADRTSWGIVTPSLGPAPEWEVDTFGYNSNTSYRLKGTAPGYTVFMQTDTIDATGNPYISLSFWNIAKIFSANQASLEYSLDAGQTWTALPLSTTYQGSSPNYGDVGSKVPYFNQVSYPVWDFQNSYATPLPSWWQKEEFDLTGVFSDTTVTPAMGHDSIIVRFKTIFYTGINGTTSFGAGWFVDDINVTGAPCELVTPKISFNFTPTANRPGYPNCFDPNPEGGQTELASTNYPIAARVTDNAKPYDTGVDSVIVVYKTNNSTQHDTITLGIVSGGPEYRGLIPNLSVGDVIDWFMIAYDNSCPANTTRMPNLSYNGTGYYNFFIEKGLPGKCGTPNCGQAPNVIRAFPWSENFDGSEWTAGTAANPPGIIPTANYWNRNFSTTSNYGWAVGNSSTVHTQYTGPANDHTTGSGKYMFFESTGNGNPAVLDLPCIDLTNYTQSGCIGFEFYYHMYGDESGELAILVDTNQNIGSSPFNPPSNNILVNVQKDEQQSSANDPWKRAVFSLDDFVGKYVRIRIRAKKSAGSTNGRSDLAIDDLRMFNPDPTDAEVIANPDPKNGYCDLQGQPVKVIVRNNGCTPLSTVPLEYTVNGVTRSVTATLDTTLYLGDTVTYAFTGANSFPAVTPGIYQVTAWADLTGDADLSNDTAQGPSLEYTAPITTFPFIEDFENATLGTQNLGNTNWRFDSGLNPNFKWLVAEEMTTERNTGPYRGFYWKGKYLYADAGGTTGGLSTFFRTLCLDLSAMGASGTKPTLDFYYHMFGADIDRLEVQVSEANEPIDKWTTVSTIFGAGQQNDEMDDWKLRHVALDAYAGTSIKVRFKATRKGSGAKTHIALDKIMVYDRASADAGVDAITAPKNRGIVAGPNNPNNPKVRLTNFGFSPLTTCTINFKITVLCNPSVTNTYQHYYNGGAIQPGNSAEVNLGSTSIQYPIGEFEACVYVTDPNGTTDNIAFNDTVCRNIIGGFNSYEIPFKFNFDTCDYDSKGFIPSQGFLQWELGKPNSGNITQDRSITGNAWVTNIDGDFLVGTREELRLPIIEEFDTVKNAELIFWQWLDVGSNPGSGTQYNVAANVSYFSNGQYEILGGTTLGTNIGENWYYAIGAPAVDIFQGGPAWTVTNTNWIRSKYPLNNFSLDSTAALTLRFQFESKSSMQQNQAAGGWGIDDFEVYIPPQNSVSPVRVVTKSPLPIPGFDQELDISVRNTGEKVVDEYWIEVFIDGVQLGSRYHRQLFNSPIIKGQVDRFTFPTKWAGVDVTSGDHNVCIYTYRPNDKPDQRSDDTLCENLPVMLELDFTASGQDEYCEDFEDPTRFQWIHKNAVDLYEKDTLWESGDPLQAGAAHSGSNAWMTNLDENYGSLEQAALFTPVFEVDSGIRYKIDFYHWISTERYHDGGNMEYSFDGGVSWYPVGYRGRNLPNWYNTDFVTALDQIRGGWTDSTAGWENAHISLIFEDYGKVIFRYRFGSDYDIHDKGWAIDDFCFTKDTATDNEVIQIGAEEYAIPEDAVIGDMVPNPATDHSELTFLFPTPQSVEIRVYSVVGQLMESRSGSYTEGVHTVDFKTSDWSSGIYFVNFEYGGKLITRKLVVK